MYVFEVRSFIDYVGEIQIKKSVHATVVVPRCIATIPSDVILSKVKSLALQPMKGLGRERSNALSFPSLRY